MTKGALRKGVCLNCGRDILTTAVHGKLPEYCRRPPPGETVSCITQAERKRIREGVRRHRKRQKEKAS